MDGDDRYHISVHTVLGGAVPSEPLRQKLISLRVEHKTNFNLCLRGELSGFREKPSTRILFTVGLSSLLKNHNELKSEFVSILVETQKFIGKPFNLAIHNFSGDPTESYPSSYSFTIWIEADDHQRLAGMFDEWFALYRSLTRIENKILNFYNFVFLNGQWKARVPESGKLFKDILRVVPRMTHSYGYAEISFPDLLNISEKKLILV